MTEATVLVVNADDFGQSAEVTEGILTAHRDGIVTSTSLMVRWPAAQEAAAAAVHHPQLAIGLHVDLGEWRCDDGEWHPVYDVVDTDDATLARQEFQRQLDRFRSLMGRDPSHLDSHQHVHRREPVQSILREAGRAMGIPVRHFSKFTYVGDFYGQSNDGSPLPGALTDEHLLKILKKLTPGRWEMACHPAAAPPPSSMYSQERVQELATLTSPRIRQAIAELGISLVPFARRSRA